jgi:hypothetical protein
VYSKYRFFLSALVLSLHASSYSTRDHGLGALYQSQISTSIRHCSYTIRESSVFLYSIIVFRESNCTTLEEIRKTIQSHIKVVSQGPSTVRVTAGHVTKLVLQVKLVTH